jgi:hypothetical protein
MVDLLKFMLLALNSLEAVEDSQCPLLGQNAAHFLSTNIRHGRTNQRQSQAQWTEL